MGINTTLPSQDDERGALWPALPYQAWQDTRETLLILDFFQSSYLVGATLGGWDRAALERVRRS
jgi:hypothetical protein